MEQKLKDESLSQWISTYGLVTVERILARYAINLSQPELLQMVKNPENFYYQLMRIPVKNVLTGIIIQQAHDFHVYTQKLFIDYLLSGETTKSAEDQGAQTREQLEDERQALLVSGDEFQAFQDAHDLLIGESQKALIVLAAKWNKTMEACLNQYDRLLTQAGITHKKSEVRMAFQHAVMHSQLQDIESDERFLALVNNQLNLSETAQLNETIATETEQLLDIVRSFNITQQDFLERAMEHHRQAIAYRTLFYDAIIRVTTLLGYLPDYRINDTQDVENRAALQFDVTLGEL